MGYGLIRMIFWLAVFMSVYSKLVHTKLLKTKRNLAALIVLWMVLWSASAFLPVENLFISFTSPESAFYYTNSGKITDIIYGDNSCLIFSSSEKAYILKSSSGYNITTMFSEKRISQNLVTPMSFWVYRVSGTDDYYVMGYKCEDIDGPVNIYDGNGDLKGTFEDVTTSGFTYAYVSKFDNRYYAIVNGKKVQIAK